MFVPDKADVKSPQKGSVANYLDKLTDKLQNRKRVQVFIGDLHNPVKQGGLGWNIPHYTRSVRCGDTSLDWEATGGRAITDGQSLADKLQREADDRGYSIVFYCVMGRIYGARNYPE